jgi:hypothetical protein
MNDCYFAKKDWRECKKEVRSYFSFLFPPLSISIPDNPTIYVLLPVFNQSLLMQFVFFFSPRPIPFR